MDQNQIGSRTVPAVDSAGRVEKSMEKREGNISTSASGRVKPSAHGSAPAAAAEVTSDLAIDFEPAPSTAKHSGESGSPSEPLSIDDKIRPAAELILSLASDSEWYDEEDKAWKVEQRKAEHSPETFSSVKAAQQLGETHPAWKCCIYGKGWHLLDLGIMEGVCENLGKSI